MPKEIIPEETKKQIKETFFKNLKDDVVIQVYTKPGPHDEFNEAAIAIVKALAELSPKLKVSFHAIGDELALQHKVTRSPTILIAPDKYRIRSTGAPIGEEGRSFLMAIMMASTGKTALSEAGAAKIREQLHEKRDIQVFVSPTCPYCPQQVLLAVSAAIINPALVSAESIEVYENQDLAEKLGSLAVPQTFINNTFTGNGLQPEFMFLDSLFSLKEPKIASGEFSGEPQDKDLVIVGGGPAGLTAAIYAARAGLDSLVLEKSAIGGQVAITPLVENYPGFMSIGGKSLTDLIAQQALQYAEVHIGEIVLEVTKDLQENRFSLKTNQAIYRAKAILLATGANYRPLDAQGAQTFYGRGVSYCATCDGYFFKDNKQVIVVGGGNTAVGDALYLHNLGAQVTLVHRRDALRAEAKLQEGLKQAGIPVLWNSVVLEILGDAVVKTVKIKNIKTGAVQAMNVHGVFGAIGYVPNNDFAKQLGVALDADGYVKTDLHTMRTSLPGVYAAGDITGAPKQIVVAVSHGSLAAMTIFEDLASPDRRN